MSAPDPRTQRDAAIRRILREAAYSIETLAYRDISRAIRAAAPDASLYSAALLLFRNHIGGERPRAWKEGRTTRETAEALRAAGREPATIRTMEGDNDRR